MVKDSQISLPSRCQRVILGLKLIVYMLPSRRWSAKFGLRAGFSDAFMIMILRAPSDGSRLICSLVQANCNSLAFIVDSTLPISASRLDMIVVIFEGLWLETFLLSKVLRGEACVVISTNLFLVCGEGVEMASGWSDHFLGADVRTWLLNSQLLVFPSPGNGFYRLKLFRLVVILSSEAAFEWTWQTASVFL